MHFTQSCIVPVLVTLTLPILDRVKKNRKTKSPMSLININSKQNKGTDKVSFFSHAEKHLHSDSSSDVHTLEDSVYVRDSQIYKRKEVLIYSS